MNKEELKQEIKGAIGYFIGWQEISQKDRQSINEFLEKKIEEFEKQIRLETLKEVLPDKEWEQPYSRQEIINKAKENWNIIL